MPGFAAKVLAVYREDDQDKLLVNQMRLQIVAGHYRDALKSIKAVRQSRAAKGDDQAATVFFDHEIFSDAMLKQVIVNEGSSHYFEPGAGRGLTIGLGWNAKP